MSLRLRRKEGLFALRAFCQALYSEHATVTSTSRCTTALCSLQLHILSANIAVKANSVYSTTSI